MGELKGSDDKEIREAPVVMERSSMPAHPHNSQDVKENNSGVRMRFLSLAAVAILSLGAGFAGGWLGAADSPQQTIQKQQVVLKSQGELISSIANEVSPSVVSVEVSAPASRAVDQFFSLPQDIGEQRSAGTGIIIDKSGLIVTNRHVVPAGSSKVSVTLSDGTKFDNVKVVGRTSESDPLDVAFLRIEDTKGKELKPARIGDSSQVKVGESVIAIGNALGQFQNTVTSGIISGYGRSLVAGDETGASTESLQNLFQTDAAINQGNSGGPLVNLDGEVIGINTAVAGNAQNIGFAIPVNDIKGVMNNVVTKGKLERPYLGVMYVPITADVTKRYDLNVTEGAYILPSVAVGQETIVKGAPADKAGLKEGDVIVKVGGETVDAAHSLTSLLGKHAVDEKVKLDVIRDGKRQTIEVTLEAAPEAPEE